MQVRSFEPDAHMRAMAQLAATTTNNLACLKLRQNPRTALPLLTSSLRMQREHMAKQHHARLAEQLFQKVDVDGAPRPSPLTPLPSMFWLGFPFATTTVLVTQLKGARTGRLGLDRGTRDRGTLTAPGSQAQPPAAPGR